MPVGAASELEGRAKFNLDESSRCVSALVFRDAAMMALPWLGKMQILISFGVEATRQPRRAFVGFDPRRLSVGPASSKLRHSS